MLQILSTHLIINTQSKNIKTFERNHEKSSNMQGFNLTIQKISQWTHNEKSNYQLPALPKGE